MAVLSHWPNKEYPILYQPTDRELIEFSQQEKWDTIRICSNEKAIGIASGFGNTHDSIVSMCRDLRWADTHILFREDGDFWFNLEAASMRGRKRHWKRCSYLFTLEQFEMIRTLIQLR